MRINLLRLCAIQRSSTSVFNLRTAVRLFVSGKLKFRHPSVQLYAFKFQPPFDRNIVELPFCIRTLLFAD